MGDCAGNPTKLEPFVFIVVGGTGRIVFSTDVRSNADAYTLLHPAFRVIDARAERSTPAPDYDPHLDHPERFTDGKPV